MIIRTTKSIEELQAEARELMKCIVESGKHDPRFAKLEGVSAFCGRLKTKTNFYSKMTKE